MVYLLMTKVIKKRSKKTVTENESRNYKGEKIDEHPKLYKKNKINIDLRIY